MNNEVVFKNDLVTLAWNDGRLKLYDSDGSYIDYFFEEGGYSVDDEQAEIELIVDMLHSSSAEELCTSVYKMCYSIKEFVSDCDDTKISTLREEYGDEFVCRIGNIAIIVGEN